MTSKQLVAAALAGQHVPRTPVGPLAVHWCAHMAGYSLRQYTMDPKALADSVLRYYERFHPDVVCLSADTWVSAQAMGAKVGAADEHQPFSGLGEPLVQCSADIDRIPSPDVTSQGRYPIMLEALQRIVEQLGKRVFIFACFDQYPFSLAAALMGINNIMLKVLDDPAFVQALMCRCSDYALAYATALGHAGADLLSGGDSPAGLLGPSLYNDLALPGEQRLISQIRAATGKPVSLHICGNATPILSGMKTSGADVLELDHAVPIDIACRVVGPDIALWGNLDPVRLLAQGTPGEVRRQAMDTLKTVKAEGHDRFVLSSGCTLAVETSLENVEALLEARLEVVERPEQRQRLIP